MHEKRTLFSCSFFLQRVSSFLSFSSLFWIEKQTNKSTNKQKQKNKQLFDNPEYKGKQSQKCIKGVQCDDGTVRFFFSSVSMD